MVLPQRMSESIIIILVEMDYLGSTLVGVVGEIWVICKSLRLRLNGILRHHASSLVHLVFVALREGGLIIDLMGA